MRNEAADIVQDTVDEIPEWKAKARVAGTAAWDATRAAYSTIEEKTVACSKATDHAIREKPYVALGIAFGAGALLGFLLTSGEDEKECCE